MNVDALSRGQLAGQERAKKSYLAYIWQIGTTDLWFT